MRWSRAHRLVLVSALLVSDLASAQDLPTPTARVSRPAPATLRAPGLTRDQIELVDELRDDDYDVRKNAAKELAEEGPPLAAVPYLLAALYREQYAEPFFALLDALGRSGVREVKPILDAHLGAQPETLRQAARGAMWSWLLRNHVIGPEEPLPEPSRILGPMPLHPDVPGAHALEELVGTPAPLGPRIPGPLKERDPHTRDAGTALLGIGGAMVFAGLLGLAVSLKPVDGPDPDKVLAWTGPLMVGGAVVMVVGGVTFSRGSQWVPIGSQTARAVSAPVPRERVIGLRGRF